MIVVQMHEQGGEINPLLAAFTRTRFDRVETIEKPVQIARRALPARIVRQRIHRFVRGATREPRTASFVVIAQPLSGTPLDAVANEISEFFLVVMSRTRLHCRHPAPPSASLAGRGDRGRTDQGLAMISDNAAR